ncbi:hypothetical protein [Streptomyces sp. TLI_185]|uniref:hypothetical protein n=1 Tax=Streptomyces sp. TLI_185 TaxID=2485151 RepID=UPI002693B808|nr:hypothetical protein [Streptomyces sp. TLI_185]
MVAAIFLIVAMPVAAGATVRTAKGDGDQPTAVGLVLASTLVSPLTVPLALAVLCPLLRGDHAGRPAGAAQTAGHAFALTSVVLPCGAGLLRRLLLPRRASDGLVDAAAAGPLPASLLLTYVNASGVQGRSCAIRVRCCRRQRRPSRRRCAGCPSRWAGSPPAPCGWMRGPAPP